ncbi:MAG: hypothetical protein QOI47_1791, partial [Actinomycetota bacterium]|nr:hypothetical protein [Actinomycetota bacterium]
GSVVPPTRLELTRSFAGQATAPGKARRLVIDLLQQWQLDDVVDDAALVTTELATNAVTHAECGFTVTLSVEGDMVRISVLDASGALPQERALDSVSSSGRGLHIVDALAVRWGTDVVAEGKLVWAELRR